MLNRFKPKQQDFDAPYLYEAAPELENQLRLVGLFGYEGLQIKQSCTLPNGAFNDAKFSGTLITRCLRLRDAQSTPVFDAACAENLAYEIDLQPYNSLFDDVLSFLGMRNTSVADAKKNLNPTLNGNSTSPLPADSPEPLTNSLEPSTPPN